MSAEQAVPFASASAYRELGWTGTVPLPPAAKWPPPSGVTGYDGRWPTPDDLARWARDGYTVGKADRREHHAAHNLALRLPPAVVGLDVDDYGDKHGAETMRQLADKLGPLPATVRSTSRTDGTSGIYLYRVPVNLTWPTEAGPDVEVIRNAHRYALVWPSVHAGTGQTYRWLDADAEAVSPPKMGSLPELPAAYVTHLTGTNNGTNLTTPGGNGSRARRRRDLAPALEWLGLLDEGEPCQRVGQVAADALAAARREDGNAYDHTRDAVLALLRCAERGHAGVGRMLPRVRAAYVDHVGDDRGGTEVAEGEFDRFTETGAKTILDTPSTDPGGGCRCRRVTPVLDTTVLARRAALGALLADLRTWQHLPDPGHIVVACAAAATAHDSGEPCWLLLVAPPSSGKTETVRMLDEAADEHLDEVTAAGLLGWSKGKTAKPTGVLTRISPTALITFGDLSTLLATSDRGGRDAVFALLRRAYDGRASRDVSPPGRTDTEHQKLEWTGRLTVIAAVTGAIDRYTAHADQLGPRWVYVRLPERDTAGKRAAAKRARRRGIAEHRDRATGLTASLVASAAANLPDELPDDVSDAIEDAALVTCWGRASVPRSGYGRREILDVPTVEEPMRLVQQIAGIARGLFGLGLDDDAVIALTQRVALDSMPAARRAVLGALATGEILSTAAVARAAVVDRKVARFGLEELEAVGIVASQRVDDEVEESVGLVTWSLAGDDGALVVDVYAGQRRCQGWDNVWVAIPPPPKEEDGDGEASHISSHPPTDLDTPSPAPIRCRDCDVELSAERAHGHRLCPTCDARLRADQPPAQHAATDRGSPS